MKMKYVWSLLVISLLSGFQFQEVKKEYKLDVAHTYIGFDVERFLVGEVSGRFNNFEGTIFMIDEDITTLKVSTVIQTKSLDTNNEIRDGHLKGGTWLDTENYPEIKFESSGIERLKGALIMTGNLTIKEVTQTVEFPIDVMGPFKDPTKQIALGLKADLIINRFDYDISFNKKMDNGSLFIGNEVKIKLRALAYLK